MPASKAQRAKTAERRSKAIQMHLAGSDWETIATALGYASRGAAHTDVSRALEVATTELQRDADVLRTVELARLDKLQAAYWLAALQGDTDAARIVQGVMDRRIKLLGLNAPERHEVISLTAMDAEISRLERELGPAPAEPIREPAGDEL